MTTEEQQHHQDTHQQSSGGGDGGRIVVPCLHCRLVKAYQQWVADYEAASGDRPCVMHMGERMGAFIGAMTAMVSESCGHDEAVLTEFAQAVMYGQATTVPVVMVDDDGQPATDTKH